MQSSFETVGTINPVVVRAKTNNAVLKTVMHCETNH